MDSAKPTLEKGAHGGGARVQEPKLGQECETKDFGLESRVTFPWQPAQKEREGEGGRMGGIIAIVIFSK